MRAACPSPGRRETSAAESLRWSTRRRRPPAAHRTFARSSRPLRCPRSISLLSLVEVLADDVEEALPASTLTVYPIRGLGERLGTEREVMRPAGDHARDDAGLLEHLQMPRDRRLGNGQAATRLTHGGGTLAEPLDDLPAGRVGQGGERIVSHFANYIGATNENPIERKADARTQSWDTGGMAGSARSAAGQGEGAHPSR